VRTVARSKPRDIFGELTTEEFYVADKRELQAQRAKDILQEMLGPMGIVVEKVLTKDYRFNQEYQKAIEDKKVADQQVQKNRSAQHAALEEYRRKLEEAKGEVNKMVADADGVYRKAKIEADVYFEKQKLLAEAIRAEGIAEAKGIQEMNNALAGTGGEAFVKLQIAEALQGKENHAAAGVRRRHEPQDNGYQPVDQHHGGQVPFERQARLRSIVDYCPGQIPGLSP
jgi:regulator of protease activity HflC (stomatin/prohibitin superfamily)